MIEFDGKIVKPDKRGFYRCPFRCGSPNYPQPKWKTEKGFRKHMSKCPNSPSQLKIKTESLNKYYKDLEMQKIEALKNVEQKIGDRIFYVLEEITKPTHVQRFNRMVRVRYEPEKRFMAGETIINKIDFNGQVLFNGAIPLHSLYSSMEEAKTKAERLQKEYDDWLKMCDMCR
jgi:hypothetical protein